jgi:hypothetical protein
VDAFGHRTLGECLDQTTPDIEYPRQNVLPIRRHAEKNPR